MKFTGPKDRNLRFFLLFWLSQSISELGSAMTSYALTIWMYTRTGSVSSVSMMLFASFLPYVLVGIFAGKFIDTHQKKRIMLLSDSVAALCSLCIVALWYGGRLAGYHIYIVNFIIGMMNAFQHPAQTIAIGILVPKDRWIQASGMNSFSTNLITVVSPVAAVALFGLGGLGLVLMVDLGTFFVAFGTLLLLIRIPEMVQAASGKKTALDGCREGLKFLSGHPELWYIIFTMSMINFFTRLTYENILPPMILARSGNNTEVLSLVSAVIGVGGVIGGLIVSTIRGNHNNARMIYFASFLSFLLGDLVMAVGRNALVWCLGGMGASLPIPFILAGQQNIWYHMIPREMQGRVFAVKNAIQFSSIPVAILLGGFLADYVFEPFMSSGSVFASFLQLLVGTGSGSGMALMFLCTGTLGSVFCLIVYRLKPIRKLAYLGDSANPV